MNLIKTIFKVMLPVFVLAASGGVAWWILENKPIPQQRPARAPQITVEATRLKPQAYQILVPAFGTVQPRTSGTLIPEVSGKVIEVSPHFRSGEFFEKDTVLLTLDSRNYQSAVKIAESALVQAKLALQEEQAKAEQALRNWKRFQSEERPNDLALRKPHLAAAKAAAQSAETRLAQAQLDLERTRIKAPYAGRILQQKVDQGQFVSPGTVLAEIYAVDYVEIRLPLTSRQLEFISLPEHYRGEAQPQTGPKVMVQAEIGFNTYQWEGQIVRTEGAIDTRSRQLFVVAQIHDPYGKKAQGNPPLKIGQFVKAEITGVRMENVFVIPRSAVYQGNQVMLVKDNALFRTTLTILWSDAQQVVVREGLREGEILSLTPVGSLVSGTQVVPVIDGQTQEMTESEQKSS